MNKYRKISEWSYEVYNDSDSFIGKIVQWPEKVWVFLPPKREIHLTHIELRRIYNKIVLISKE